MYTHYSHGDPTILSSTRISEPNLDCFKHILPEGWTSSLGCLVVDIYSQVVLLEL